MEIVIRNAILDRTGEPVEIGVEAGKIACMQKKCPQKGETELDAQGGIVSSAFVEPHFHLENALMGDIVNKSGTLDEAIKIYASIKQDMTREDIIDRATRGLRLALSNGTLWLRSHVDIDQIAKLYLLKAEVTVQEKFKNLIDVQLIAFPQLGLARNSEAVEMMWQAMENGANIVGGMPHGERNMDEAARHIEIAFEIAKKYNTDIDMHVDETDDPYWHSLELLADKTIESGWEGRVCAGHCCSMSAWDKKLVDRVIQKVFRAKITVIANAPVNMILQGRNDRNPKRRGVTLVKELLEAGVNVTCGQDDMQNMFYPFGRMDPLETSLITAHAAHLSSPIEIQAAFNMPRNNAAQGWGIKDYGIQIGNSANLVVLQESSPVDALRLHAPRRWVIREGKLLYANQSTPQWFI